MISIQTGMLVALGFFIASLVWLLLASAFWSRAVRLTTDRLKRSMPISEAEIQADRDRLRAEHAIKVHSLEKRLSQAKLERARHVIEINRRDARISVLENEMVGVRSELDEHQNARRVLEQTVADRLPKVEARLTEAKRLLFNRDREIAELTQNARQHKLALEEASAINAQKEAEIERLNSALVARGGRSRRAGTEQQVDSDVALRAEVEALRAKTRDQANLIDRLQLHLGTAPGQAELKQAKETLAEAEAGLRAVRSPVQSEPAVTDLATKAKEIRALQEQIEEQAGEIVRLKAALAAVENPDGDSKLFLKARVGSAEAQAERQAATIAKLKAELAAANERLARQATHFMDEMRRIGGTPDDATTTPSQRPAARNGEARKLAERVAQVRPTIAEKPRPVANVHTAVANGTDHEHDAKPAAAPEKAPEPELVVASASAPPAAEMPQTAAIPGERRKLRLLDRITSLSKS